MAVIGGLSSKDESALQIQVRQDPAFAFLVNKFFFYNKEMANQAVQLAELIKRIRTWFREHGQTLFDAPFQLRSATKTEFFLPSLKTSMGVRYFNTFLGLLLSKFSISSTVSSASVSNR